MGKVLENWHGRISVAEKRIWNLRYADDTTLIAKTENKMAVLLQRLEYESELHGLRINRQKTKIIDRWNSLQFIGALSNLETVSSFLYLRSILDREENCEKEIRRRISMGKKRYKRPAQNMEESIHFQCRQDETCSKPYFCYISLRIRNVDNKNDRKEEDRWV